MAEPPHSHISIRTSPSLSRNPRKYVTRSNEDSLCLLPSPAWYRCAPRMGTCRHPLPRAATPHPYPHHLLPLIPFQPCSCPTSASLAVLEPICAVEAVLAPGWGWQHLPVLHPALSERGHLTLGYSVCGSCRFRGAVGQDRGCSHPGVHPAPSPVLAGATARAASLPWCTAPRWALPHALPSLPRSPGGAPPKTLPYGSPCWRAPGGSRDQRSSSTASSGPALPLRPGHGVALTVPPLRAALTPRPAGLEPNAGTDPQLRPAPLSPLLRTVMLLRFAFTLGHPRGVAARYIHGSSPTLRANRSSARRGRKGGSLKGDGEPGSCCPTRALPARGRAGKGWELRPPPTERCFPSRCPRLRSLCPPPLHPGTAAPRHGCGPAPLLLGSNAASPDAAPLPTDDGPGAPGAVHRPYGRPDCLPPEV